MDLSIVKLEDEGESMHSGDDLDSSQAALIRDTEDTIISQGKTHSSSQQLATRNNGSIEDANGNLHRQHLLESTENQELKRENESHLQHNPPKDHCQPGQLWENPSHVPQASDLKSINNPVGNGSERPQQVHRPTPAKVCEILNILKAQQLGKNRDMQLLTLFHKFKRKEITEIEFIRHMVAVVDDKQTIRLVLSKLKRENMKIKVPGPPNHNKVSSASAEISAQESDLRGVHVNQLPSTTSGTLSSSATVQGLNKHPQQHMQLPSSSFHIDTNSGRLNQYPETNVASPGSSSRAKLHEIQMMQSVGSTGVGGPTKSTINTTTAPKFERLTSVNGPSRVQGGPISHLQNNLSLPLYPDPCKGPVTKDQTVGPSSSLVHVKQKSIDESFDQAKKPRSLVQQGVTNVPMKQNNAISSRSNDDLEKQYPKMVLSTSTTHASSVSPSMTTQLDSSTMVNFPAPSGTIPERANVRTTPEIPSVGQKKPLEAVGSSLPPSSKKQKLCGDSSDQSINRLNDVTAVSGINLREEEKRLLVSGPKRDGRFSKSSRRVVHEEEERTVLRKIPLQRKLTEIMAKSGLKHIDHDVERCLSVCVEERMRGLLSNIIRMSKQRTDAEKFRNEICITSDIRKQMNEMNQKVKEKWERKHGGEEKVKNEENDTEKEDNRSKKVKAKKKEEDEMRAKAANAAALVAAGGDDKFLKWKIMGEAHQKSSSGPGKNSKKLAGETGGTRFGKNQGLPKVVRSISVKDVIAVVEKEPQMSRSTLLYRRIEAFKTKTSDTFFYSRN